MAKTREGVLIGLGLSEENLRRLKLDQTITVHLREMIPSLDHEIDVLLFAGSDEIAMTLKLRGLLGPDTIVRTPDDDSRG